METRDERCTRWFYYGFNTQEKIDYMIDNAKYFAHKAHDMIQQKRKYTGQPYWVHVDAVAETVKKFGGTPDMIMAAYLHDYKEDVIPALFDANRIDELIELEKHYDRIVTPAANKLVYELTDVFVTNVYPTQGRNWRKAQEAARIAKISNEAKTIKLADLLDNTVSIVQHDPDFAITYLKEKARIMQGLVGGNRDLYKIVEKQLENAVDKLDVNL
jgi:guanosine-3',5'-bis(diphosphate) 3'-pyrophosphohydrolase